MVGYSRPPDLVPAPGPFSPVHTASSSLAPGNTSYLPLSGSLLKKNLLLPPIGFQSVTRFIFVFLLEHNYIVSFPRDLWQDSGTPAFLGLRTFEGSLPPVQNQPTQQMLRKNYRNLMLSGKVNTIGITPARNLGLVGHQV